MNLYHADGTKIAARFSNGDEIQYRGSFIYRKTTGLVISPDLEAVTVPGGMVLVSGSTWTPYAYVSDHLGSTREIANLSTGTIVEQNDYYAFGTKIASPASSTSFPQLSANRWRYSGKEEQNAVTGLQHLDYGARHYDPFLGSWTAPDPMAEKYYGWSPYNFCADNPVMYYDVIGMRPIYNREGRFLGTDDNGLQGNPIVMEDTCFTQGMSAAAAEQYNLGLESLLNSHAIVRLWLNQNLLKTRPDYDGFVTIIEGVLWAHLHPYALKTPSPKNTLYINTALLDFGHPDISNEEWMDLLNFDNIISSFTNRNIRSTVYALGHVKINIINELDGIIAINNEEGSGTDYDWNLGGSKIRNTLIRINNAVFQLDPDIHGFKTYYYGQGRLKR